MGRRVGDLGGLRLMVRRLPALARVAGNRRCRIGSGVFIDRSRFFNRRRFHIGSWRIASRRLGDHRLNDRHRSSRLNEVRDQQRAHSYLVLRMRTEGNRHLEFTLHEFGDNRHPTTSADQDDRVEVTHLNPRAAEHPGGHYEAVPNRGPNQRYEFLPTQPYGRAVSR